MKYACNEVVGFSGDKELRCVREAGHAGGHAWSSTGVTSGPGGLWHCPHCSYTISKQVKDWESVAADHLDKHQHGRERLRKVQRSYDSTIARMAGNIAAGLVADYIKQFGVAHYEQPLVIDSVAVAHAIVEEVKRTEKEQP